MSQNELDINAVSAPIVLWCEEHQAHFVEGDECGHEFCQNSVTCHGYVGGRQVSCGGIEKPCLLSRPS